MAAVKRLPWVLLLGLPVLAYWLTYALPPASHWLRAGPILAFDAPVGSHVVLEIDREIRRPFTAQWRVLVRRFEPSQGWVVVCAASGGGDYRPDAALPQPLTLDWWTDGQCPHPPEGRIMVSTVWRIDTGLPGVRQVISESNVFTVEAVE